MRTRNAPAPERIWWTRRGIGFHVTLVIVVPAFLGLFWWQVDRVREGNTLSWCYVFEWPFFTCYAVYLWWKLVHDQAQDDAARQGGPGRKTPVGVGLARRALRRRGAARDPGVLRGEQEARDAEDEEELAAYNRYLEALHSSGRRKQW